MDIQQWPHGLKAGQWFGDCQLMQYLGRRGTDHVFRVICRCNEVFPALLTDLRNGKVQDCSQALSRVCSVKRQAAPKRTEDDDLRAQVRRDMQEYAKKMQDSVFSRTR